MGYERSNNALEGRHEMEKMRKIRELFDRSRRLIVRQCIPRFSWVSLWRKDHVPVAGSLSTSRSCTLQICPRKKAENRLTRLREGLRRAECLRAASSERLLATTLLRINRKALTGCFFPRAFRYDGSDCSSISDVALTPNRGSLCTPFADLIFREQMSFANRTSGRNHRAIERRRA